MGIVEIFTEHADKYGIAIVNTQGLLTEYGKDLMKEAQKQGGHVAILSDYDDHGLLMAPLVYLVGEQAENTTALCSKIPGDLAI
jgi:hypothetical protein